MEKKKRQTDEVFGLSELSFGTSHKVLELKLKLHLKASAALFKATLWFQVEDFRLLAAQNLQLAIYRSRTQPDPKVRHVLDKAVSCTGVQLQNLC